MRGRGRRRGGRRVRVRGRGGRRGRLLLRSEQEKEIISEGEWEGFSTLLQRSKVPSPPHLIVPGSEEEDTNRNWQLFLYS